MSFFHRMQRLAMALLLLTAVCAHAADQSGQTRYPIVLVHGFLQFDKLFGVEGFYGVPKALRDAGATVLVASVPIVNDDAVRGEELLRQLRQWQAANGYAKFNLVGHSQGGTTARYVAGVAPDLVASVTTIGTPHYLDGTGQVMTLMALAQSQPGIFDTLGTLMEVLTGHAGQPVDTKAVLQDYMSKATDFNVRFPDGKPTETCGQGAPIAHGIRYYSATGNKAKTNPLDLIDLIHAEGTTPSDGMMPVCTTHWGQVLRDTYPWNHYDEINQLFGLIGVGAPDPTSFYVQQASRLKLAGL